LKVDAVLNKVADGRPVGVEENVLNICLLDRFSIACFGSNSICERHRGAINHFRSWRKPCSPVCLADMQQLEQAMGALQLNVGRPVVLNGLKSASHLNGSQGRLQQWDAAAERWQVFLITGPDKGKKKGVKAENLSPVVEDAVPLAINGVSELTESGTVAYAEAMLQQVGKTDGQDSFAMDTWLKLPGMGETFVRFVADDGPQGHLFYKFLNQHQATIEFSCSKWHSEIIRFEVTDVLVMCEVKEAWPFCFLCKKFLLPPEDHRNSKAHRKMQSQIAYNSAAYMRSWADMKVQNRCVYSLQPDI
jgi:hypothetical protein